MWLPSFTLASLMDTGQIRFFLNSSNDGLSYRVLWIVTKWKSNKLVEIHSFWRSGEIIGFEVSARNVVVHVCICCPPKKWIQAENTLFLFSLLTYPFLSICHTHTHTHLWSYTDLFPESWHCPLNYPNNEITVFPSCERCERWGFWVRVVCV